jgi:hypothetical protein
MKESHLSLRLPAVLARALAKWAAARGIPKSQVAREAVVRYLSPPTGNAQEVVSLTARDLAQRWRGLPRLDPEEADALAADIATARKSLPPPAGSWE